MHQRSPVVLVVLDGWGYSDNLSNNAIANASTPQWDSWWSTCPHLLLDASGESVGLPKGQMGNSEVGHMHIGAGRTILQNYTFINNAINNGDFAKNPAFLKTIETMKKNNNAIHIMGLLSDGGVHSHQNHLFAFLKLCNKLKFNNVYLHLFLDGRDTPPQSAKQNISALRDILSSLKEVTISTVSGRYYAMDRDKRWQRTEKVYNLLVNNNSEYSFSTIEQAIAKFYDDKIYDEFIPPTKIGDSPPIKDGDSVFFFNFRADRARQLSKALFKKDFDGFQRKTTLNKLSLLTMTQYEENLGAEVAFPPKPLTNTLGEVIAKNELQQLRIAETEKYAHVTFFLNGGTEVEFPKEDRVLIPSPKVATYDLKPEMSSENLTKQIVDAIDRNIYDVIICNYANADMVGHSGKYSAAVSAVEALDKSMQILGKKILSINGELLITADHGNAECMFNEETGQPHTAHTTEPVPLLYVGHKKLQFKQTKASLSDVAPTFLALLGIKPPNEMTGKVLWTTE
jgi:2,3-bisphosphoglycerate-independent phosphoglycerate mutase